MYMYMNIMYIIGLNTCISPTRPLKNILSFVVHSQRFFIRCNITFLYTNFIWISSSVNILQVFHRGLNEITVDCSDAVWSSDKALIFKVHVRSPQQPFLYNIWCCYLVRLPLSQCNIVFLHTPFIWCEQALSFL